MPPKPWAMHGSREQLTTLAGAVRCGRLEIPKLVRAFEQSSDAAVGQSLRPSTAPGAPSLTRLPGSGGRCIPRRSGKCSLLEQLTVNREKQKARLVELDPVLTGGDIQRGRDLFFANKKAICATCHAVQGEGGKIGPDLTRIGAVRASADLLEAIVFPSASFARGYEPITLATDNGQVLSGIIGRESSDAIYLFNNARAEIRVPRSSIESLEQSTVSIMPEGMDAQLSGQELADLIAFCNRCVVLYSNHKAGSPHEIRSRVVATLLAAPTCVAPSISFAKM
jgi:putative heme-binding domain-containing protein